MRKVEIIEEPKGQRRWVAIDRKTGKPVLRLHDEYVLMKICQRLGWQISSSNPPQSAKAA